VRSFFIALSLIFVGLACAPEVYAQGAGRPAQTLITSFRLDKDENEMLGTLYATINGAESQIADAVIDAWLIEKGRNLVYSKRDGAGGFEDEGQSLRVYNARTRQTRKIMSEYYMIDSVTEVQTTTGKTALLVKLTDGGLGAYYLAVVDPTRGEVLFRPLARLLSRRGDLIRVGRYREDIEWSEFYTNENAKIRPYKIEQFDLKAVLRRPVIVNKRDRPFE
jgi:hypothetical protein